MTHRSLLGTTAAPLALVAVTLCLLVGCAPKKREQAVAPAPPPTFTGPTFLRGTVGSLASLRNYRAEGTAVSGYGLVTGLYTTGSKEVPAVLRQRLINEMRKKRVGSVQAEDWPRATPSQVLDSLDTAVVMVEGVVPPGATKGTRFDLLVVAHPQTQTTSLAGGSLLPLDLAVGGLDPTLKIFPIAEGGGPVYIGPYDMDQAGKARDDFMRQAVIVKGGVVSEDMPVQLVLAQPSWVRSREIANRINERFGFNTDRLPIAEPKTDRLIEINIPDRHAANPTEFLDLMGYVWVDRPSGFEQAQAAELAEIAMEQPKHRGEIVQCWKVLGRVIIPTLQSYYDHPDIDFRLGALEAGAWLGDARAGTRLAEMVDQSGQEMRIRLAKALANDPQNPRAQGALRRLFDDPSTDVRIAAYESTWRINPKWLQANRTHVYTSRKRLKYVVDVLPAERPLIYVTQDDVPRIVLFKPDMGFSDSVVGQVWDNRLMVRTQDPAQPMIVFYQPKVRGADSPTSETYPVWPATVLSLVRLLGHEPTMERPEEGLGLSYGEVVDGLYRLCAQGAVEAPIIVRRSELEEAVDDAKRTAPPPTRPELGEAGSGEPPSTAAITSEAPAPPQDEPVEQGRPETSQNLQ